MTDLKALAERAIEEALALDHMEAMRLGGPMADWNNTTIRGHVQDKRVLARALLRLMEAGGYARNQMWAYVQLRRTFMAPITPDVIRTMASFEDALAAWDAALRGEEEAK